jgi:hypothetical protein
MQKRVTIRDDVRALGQSPRKFSRFSKISQATLLRMERDEAGILPQTWARAEREFQKFKALIEHQETRASA